MAVQDSILENGWRTALALCGEESAAGGALAAAAVAFRDVTRAARARFEARVLDECRARRATAAPEAWPGPARRLWDAAGALPPTDFEAWILSEARGLPADRVALVFDLPIDFVRRGIESSRVRLRGSLGDGYDGGLAALREVIARAGAAGAVAHAAAILRRAGRRERAWAAVKLAVFLAGLALASYALLDLMRWRSGAGGGPPAREPESVYSLPKPSASATR